MISGSHGDYANPAHLKGHVEASRAIRFELILKHTNAAQASALAAAVSDPKSASYHHYLSNADWNRQFAPSDASVAAAKAWLRSQGFRVGDVPSNSLYVGASGSAAQVEHAFGTTLNDYDYNGKTLRAASSDLSVGSSLAGVVDGVVGVDDTHAFVKPNIIKDGAAAPSTKPPKPPFPPGGPYPPSTGFRNAPPCNTFYGTAKDTTDPAYGGGFPANPPYVVCGYTPPKLRQAYGINTALNSGMDGTGQTVAIIDAYDSPTIASDAQKYAAATDAAHPFKLANFTDIKQPTYEDGQPAAFGGCDAPGWFGEQTLDVEAVHGMAPGAKIVYVAGHSCQNMDLDNALNTVVSQHLAQIVSNSYGNLGEVVPKSDIKFYDAELVEAAAKGIGVYFSSGDNGDEIANLGVPSPDFPASHPLVIAVGGTSLAVTGGTSATVNGSTSAGATYGFETAWMTGKSYLCTAATTPLLGACTGAPVNTWAPPAPGFLVYGSGGGTSRLYSQPAYQQGAVPASVSQRYGPSPMRAVPDVAADGDPTTGMLIGQTQLFPTGTFWDTYRIGGTSLSSPLFAGMMAVADQVAGFAHGFANPAFYRLTGTSAFHDITANGKISNVRVDFLNGLDASGGTFNTQRTFGYQGPETFCSTPTACIVRPLTLHATPGWDNETGNGSPNGWAFLNALK